jgi:hypothetical protein
MNTDVLSQLQNLLSGLPEQSRKEIKVVLFNVLDGCKAAVYFSLGFGGQPPVYGPCGEGYHRNSEGECVKD